jgi:hypothetical protein
LLNQSRINLLLLIDFHRFHDLHFLFDFYLRNSCNVGVNATE